MQGNKIDVAQSRSKASTMKKIDGDFQVTFLKKDGAVRKMNARMMGDIPLKGGKSTLNPEQYTTVFDTDKREYRAVNNDTIIELTWVSK
jgi:hypothetical protein